MNLGTVGLVCGTCQPDTQTRRMLTLHSVNCTLMCLFSQSHKRHADLRVQKAVKWQQTFHVSGGVTGSFRRAIWCVTFTTDTILYAATQWSTNLIMEAPRGRVGPDWPSRTPGVSVTLNDKWVSAESEHWLQAPDCLLHLPPTHTRQSHTLQQVGLTWLYAIGVAASSLPFPNLKETHSAKP